MTRYRWTWWFKWSWSREGAKCGSRRIHPPYGFGFISQFSYGSPASGSDQISAFVKVPCSLDSSTFTQWTPSTKFKKRLWGEPVNYYIVAVINPKTKKVLKNVKRICCRHSGGITSTTKIDDDESFSTFVSAIDIISSIGILSATVCLFFSSPHSIM